MKSIEHLPTEFLAIYIHSYLTWFTSEAPQQQQALANTHCSQYIPQLYLAVHTYQLTVLHTDLKASY